MTNRIDVFKPTQDNWYGSFQLKGWCDGVQNQMLVEVSFCGNISPPGRQPTWRVCVSGNDDYSLTFDCDNEAQAHTLFLQVIGQEFVNQQPLRDMGFEFA